MVKCLNKIIALILTKGKKNTRNEGLNCVEWLIVSQFVSDESKSITNAKR